jgi:hypothetical protein
LIPGAMLTFLRSLTIAAMIAAIYGAWWILKHECSRRPPVAAESAIGSPVATRNPDVGD